MYILFAQGLLHAEDKSASLGKSVSVESATELVEKDYSPGSLGWKLDTSEVE